MKLLVAFDTLVVAAQNHLHRTTSRRKSKHTYGRDWTPCLWIS